MKKVLLVLLFVVSVFGNTNIEIPKEIGDVDGAVYTADKKTLYTLKNETVTKWSVKPLKKLDSFETTVNHLRNYVAGNVDDEYLQKFRKSYRKPLKLDEESSILEVSSQYIAEKWDLKNKQLISGEPKRSSYVRVRYGKKPYKHYRLAVFNHYYKPIDTIKVSIDNKRAYEIYLNPLICWNCWGDSSWLILKIDLKQEFVLKESCKIVVGMTDGMSLTYYFKKLQRKPYRVFLQKLQIDKPYEKVWNTSNPSESMRAMYGTIKSTPFQPAKYNTSRDGLAYRIAINSDGFDFDSFLIYNSLEQNGALYPIMILNSNALNMKSKIAFTLNGHQLYKGSHSDIEEIHFRFLGQTKNKKVYQWNVVIPGLKNLGSDP